MMRRPPFLLLVLVCSLAPGARAGEGGGADEAEKKTSFQHLKFSYEAHRRNHTEEGKRIKRNCIEKIGDLRYPLSVSFLGGILTGEKEPALQVAALVALGKVGTPQAVQAAFIPATNPRSDDLFRDALPWGMRYCHDEAAAAWVAKRILRSANSKIRLAAVESLGVMECRSAVEGLIRCLKDRDILVRYEAVRSLGRIGDERALEPLRGLTGAKDWRLREACAFALGSFKDPKSFCLLKTALLDETWQVRESAVFSLRRIGNKEAVESLIGALGDSNRRVAVEIRETLKAFTEKDFGFDIDLWQAWWRAKGRKEAGAPPKPELTAPATYHGLKIESDRVLFIIDTSGSMDWGDRISRARQELSRALHGLDSKTDFNIMTFSDNPLFFRKEMIPASKKNLDDADIWLMKQLPFSGTNTFDTLKRAVEEIKGVDTIYFLSDGIPTRGKYLAQEKILAELNKMNRFRMIRIHAIAFLIGNAPQGVDEDKEGAERFMKRLAEENQGKFVCVK